MFGDLRRGSKAAILAAATLALIAVSLTSGCRWREGREVWLTRTEAGPSDAGADCGDNENPCRVSAHELWGALESGTYEIEIVDIRSIRECQAGRIPGARCVPFVNGPEFADEIDCDGDGWILLYDGNGASVAYAAWELPDDCERLIVVLAEGFASWSVDCPDCTIESGPPSSGEDETPGGE